MKDNRLRETLVKAIRRLAIINASGDAIGMDELAERRTIVSFLEKSSIIELGVPKEAGKFVFTSGDAQDIYLDAFKKQKDIIASETLYKMQEVYWLVRWPESEILSSQEWFHECHLADNEKLNSHRAAYFVPVSRMQSLIESMEEKLKEKIIR